MENPLGSNLKENAEAIFLTPSFNFIKELRIAREFQISSPYPTINTTTCTIRLNENNDVEFIGSSIKSGPGYQPVDFQHDNYGFDLPFALIRDGKVYAVPAGLDLVQISFTPRAKIDGTFIEVTSSRALQNNYIRLILDLDGINSRLFRGYVTKEFKTEQYFVASGLMNLEVEGLKLRMIDCHYEAKRHLIIDCLIPTDLSTFKKVAEVLMVVNGVCWGAFIRGKSIVLFSSDSEFREIIDFSYIKYSNSKTGISVLKPTELGQLKEGIPKEHRAISVSVLNKICGLAINSQAFQRALTIIAESHETAIVTRAATYCVALEAIRNFILDDDTNSFTKPIKDRALSKEIRNSFRSIIEGYSEEEFNDRDSILKKIDNLNQFGNTEGFMKIFELHSITLDEVDKETLKKRNDFLHGRLPFSINTSDEDKELSLVLLRLHLLLCVLILKLGGFEGYFSNNIRWKFRELQHEPVFRGFGKLDDLFYP